MVFSGLKNVACYDKKVRQ